MWLVLSTRLPLATLLGGRVAVAVCAVSDRHLEDHIPGLCLRAWVEGGGACGLASLHLLSAGRSPGRLFFLMRWPLNSAITWDVRRHEHVFKWDTRGKYQVLFDFRFKQPLKGYTHHLKSWRSQDFGDAQRLCSCQVTLKKVRKEHSTSHKRRLPSIFIHCFDGRGWQHFWDLSRPSFQPLFEPHTPSYRASSRRSLAK